MAAVIRVKRKRTADPADTLVLSCKKSKQIEVGSSGEGSAEPTDISNLFRFAGTVRTPNEPVDKIESAIKVAKENYKKSGHKSHIEHIHSKSRELRKSSSLSSRYKVVSSKRDLAIAAEDSTGADSPVSDLGQDGKTDKGDLCDNKENSVSNLQESAKAGAVAGNSATEKEISRLCCLYDVVQEEDAGIKHAGKPSPDKRKAAAADPDVLMCNNVQMIREKLTIEDETKPKALEPEYVYDLYYADPATLDLDALQNIVSIVGYSEQEFVFGHDDDDRMEHHGDYDDDSNDESNWRNDYPDEDPHYYGEDGEVDYEHGGYHGHRELSSDDDDEDSDDNMEYRHRRINYEYEVQDYDEYHGDDHDGFLV